MKFKFACLFVCLVTILFDLYGQTISEAFLIRRMADSLYRGGLYLNASKLYLDFAKSSKYSLHKKGAIYSAACCQALAGNKDTAIQYLKSLIYDLRFKDYLSILGEGDLKSIKSESFWGEVEKLQMGRQEAMQSPRNPQLITTDVHNFWKAFDAAQKDTASSKEIFQELYFDKGSEGLEDYFASKIGTVESFVINQERKPLFYKAIRRNTYLVDGMKEQMKKRFEKLKSIYPEALFPDMYFVIGRCNSAGTVSDNGMLIGLDQIVRSPDIPLTELNKWEKDNFHDVNKIPVIVAHELIHFQQSAMANDTTLLSNAIREGMADFIAEIITGINPSQLLQEYAKDKRLEIWNEFKAEMYLNRSNKWIANGSMDLKGKPADLGYYMGYEICKSYYEQAKDRNGAIYEMLHIKNYKVFLGKSKYEETVNSGNK